MKTFYLKSKIHRVTVTGGDLNYEGSITIDSRLMDLARIAPYEQVHIYNITSGHRFVTYAIPGRPESGEIIINGAAVHRASAGDIIIVAAYGLLDVDESVSHQPVIVKVDGKNHPIKS